MAYTHSYGFGKRYQAPRSGAFGGTLGKPKTPSTTPPVASPAGSGGGSPAGPYGAPQGYTVQQSTLPPDPAYQQTIGGLTTTRDDTLSGLQTARGQGLAAYGYTETADPNNPLYGTLAFDPNDPYSQAALALKSYNQAKTGNTTSYASQGQLYAGSLQNAQNAAADSYGAENNRIIGALQSFLTGNTTAQNTARDAYNTGAGTAYGQSVQNAPNNPLYQPFSAASSGGGVVSTDANGNTAITAANGNLQLGPQTSKFSTVKLTSGYSVVYGPDGKVVAFLDPNGNRVP